MTTSLEIASTTANQPWEIAQVGQAHAVYNSQSRVLTAKPANPAQPATVEPDTADISAASATLAAATQEESRAARIEALRQSIADGNYSVSSYRVATSIIQSLL